MTQLAGTKDARMAGENLLDERASRARHADDKNRRFRLESPSAHFAKVGWIIRGNDVGNPGTMLGGVESAVAFDQVALPQNVRLLEIREGLIVFALFLVYRGQGKAKEAARQRR